MNAGTGYGICGYGGNLATVSYSQFYSNGGHFGNAGGDRSRVAVVAPPAMAPTTKATTTTSPVPQKHASNGNQPHEG